METIVTERPHACDIRVWHGEDWFDAIPQFVNPVTGAPFSLAGKTLRLFMRPSLNHATQFGSTLSNNAGILIDNAASGLASIFYAKSSVETNLPITTTATAWEQFLRIDFTDPDLGAVKKLIWTGKLFIHPARDT